MSLGTNKRSMSNGSKTLLLSYWNGKYSVSYQHGTQKYIIKNDIDDETITLLHDIGIAAHSVLHHRGKL